MCGTLADVFKHPINARAHTYIRAHAHKPKKIIIRKEIKIKLYSNVTNCRSFIPAMIDP